MGELGIIGDRAATNGIDPKLAEVAEKTKRLHDEGQGRFLEEVAQRRSLGGDWRQRNP